MCSGRSKGVQGMQAPGGPNSFNIIQFLGKFGKIMLVPPLDGWCPTLGKSWIHHWCVYMGGSTSIFEMESSNGNSSSSKTSRSNSPDIDTSGSSWISLSGQSTVPLAISEIFIKDQWQSLCLSNRWQWSGNVSKCLPKLFNHYSSSQGK